MLHESNTKRRAAIELKSAPSTDRATPRTPGHRYRPRRTTADRLRDAMLALAQGQAKLISHEETAWNSITFSGTRHEIAFEFTGAQAVAAGEELIAQLPEHEFTIPGQLVADATVREVDHRFGAEERLVATCVLLLLEES
ncbi:hypothetical protein [Erythrobacter sp.]|jgi:hypothetical protein|uniref:hypothetical protein n=1 Tax=Erythrobacter sp. TaxID=1042 RepID=UPI002EB4B0D7|nr:hypothetical protein [Erythrobacter sp.]